ncbi:MAG: glycerol-3-phosphate acyltransferase [Ardenticatenaceae bacterium]|nr:glycerol-3-phosphate acyltransferase [Anaerolineales bacterium]MCB8921478.1 glycerol-3-phosphate acyltransferase [Ardenticatenaceae bacterium]MCB9004952.1 glycerol-3-phosphate acyltransferase [Ardenticatenaceae bacterium]
MNILYFVVAGIIGYLWGAIPFGFLYVRIKRKDIDLRDFGSGRTGGTNSLRAAGWQVGTITGLSDVFKGFMGVWLSKLILANVLSDTALPWAVIAAGVMTVVGHNWSVFLSWRRKEGKLVFIGWRGGAGTGPNVGWSTGVWWPMFPIGLAVMVGLLVGVGMASVASMAMAAIIPIVFGIRYAMRIDSSPAYLVGGLITMGIVLWALRPNIKRLIEGNERVVGPRAKRIAKREKASSQ